MPHYDALENYDFMDSYETPMLYQKVGSSFLQSNKRGGREDGI